MNMESPVSAFAVYNKNKPKQNTSKKSTKKATKLKVAKNIVFSDELTKKAAQLLKQKTTITPGKKKIHKKKKKSKSKKKFSNPTQANSKPIGEPKMVNDTESLDSEVPMLVPATVIAGDGGGYTEEGFPDKEINDQASNSSQESFEFVPVQSNSVSLALKAFKWMIAPYDPQEFFVNIWEKKPLHLSRKNSNYYKDIISTPKIDNMLRTEHIEFTKNIDITSYVDNKRETHNPAGRAHPHVVWDYYLNGCSIRLLNPQTYLAKLHLLNATMQEFFNCFVGANAYLTPPDSQGFAPHYDDIEAFILQVEGKKHWKIYKPLTENETLPRVSSKNFDPSEIGEPLMEITLEAGDMLYFPRGFIHQGCTIDGEHSLHVTISMYQKHAWADLLEKLIPAALQATINANIDLRKGLPFDIYDNFGLVNSDIDAPRKRELIGIIKSFVDRIKDHLPVEEAVDELSKNYQRDALPPVLNDREKSVTVYGDSDVMISNGKVINRIEISLDCRIRLLRKNILRMVMEDEAIRIYYCVDNSLEYHGNELQFLEIDEHLAPAIETLIMSYPQYVFVENLDVPSESDKLQIANDLWERGLVMTEYPLNTLEEE